jgi:hypothetical protein
MRRKSVTENRRGAGWNPASLDSEDIGSLRRKISEKIEHKIDLRKVNKYISTL